MEQRTVTNEDLANSIRTLSDTMVGRMDKFDGQMDKLDGRIDQLDNRLSGRMDKFDGRMDKLDSRMDGLEGKIDQLDSNLSGRMTDLEEVVDGLAISTAKNFEQTNGRLDILTREVIRHGDILQGVQNTMKSHQEMLVDVEFRLQKVEA